MAILGPSSITELSVTEINGKDATKLIFGATADAEKVASDVSEGLASVTRDETTGQANFHFKIPAGDNPVFLSFNPDAIPILADNAGGISDPTARVVSSISVYEAAKDVTSDYTFTANFSTSTITGSITNNQINFTGWGSSEDSVIITITATKKDRTIKVSKGIAFFKSKEGMQGERGFMPSIAPEVGVTLDNTSSETPTGTATATYIEDSDNVYKLSFNFKGLKPERTYLPIGTVYAYAGKDLPAGTAALNGQTITKAAYPDFYTWAEANAPRISDSKAFDAEVAAFGFCGKFVVTSESVRLPNLNGAYIQGTNSDTSVGTDLKDTGRDIAGTITADGLTAGNATTTGSFAASTADSSKGIAAYNNTSGLSGNKIAISGEKAWGADHVGTEFRPKSVMYKYVIQIYSSIVYDLQEIQAADFITIANQALSTAQAVQDQINALTSALLEVSSITTDTLKI